MNKNIYTLSIIWALTFASIDVFAQQDPMVSQYMFNGLYLSPAYAGVRKAPNITGTFRKQWTALDGAPVTQTLSYDQKLGSKMGAGLILVNDKIGVTGTTDIYADYSYHLKLAKDMQLSLGLMAGASNYRADLTKLKIWDTDDQNFSSNIVGKWIPNFGFGSYLKGEKYFAGISIPKILSYDPAAFLHVNMDKSPLYERHYYLTGGYEIAVKEKYTIQPSLLFKYVPNAPMQVDVNVLGFYKNMFGIGLSYRSKNAMVALLELKTQKRFTIGYSFDYIFSNLSKYSSGSHEIMIAYDLEKGIASARFGK